MANLETGITAYLLNGNLLQEMSAEYVVGAVPRGHVMEPQ